MTVPLQQKETICFLHFMLENEYLLTTLGGSNDGYIIVWLKLVLIPPDLWNYKIINGHSKAPGFFKTKCRKQLR